MDISFLLDKPIAHRGLHGTNLPENAKTAFELAIKNNYPIETDVRYTKDNQIIVFHDSTLDRTTNGKGLVREHTLSQIKELSLHFNDDKVMTFKEFLKLVDGKVPILIELKYMKDAPDFTKKLIEELEDYSGLYAFQSFNPIYLKSLRKLAPDKPIGLLSDRYFESDIQEFEGGYRRLTAFVLRHMFLNFTFKPDFYSFRADDLPFYKCTSWKKKGGIILGWTIRSQQDYEKHKDKVDNIIFENFIPEL